MLKEKTTWLLIILLLSVALIGALDHKKSVADEATTTLQKNDLYK